jgi:hypothetical protein
MSIIGFFVLGSVILVLLLAFAISLSKSQKQTKAPVFSYTQGEIKELTDTTAVIHYNVGDKTYRLTETLRTKEEAIKVGEVTVGHKQVPIVKAYVGQSVAIAYDAKDNAKAYWVGNHGASE